jgi:hypothetical protein
MKNRICFTAALVIAFKTPMYFQRVDRENDCILNLGPFRYSGEELCIIQIHTVESPGSAVPVGSCVRDSVGLLLWWDHSRWG